MAAATPRKNSLYYNHHHNQRHTHIHYAFITAVDGSFTLACIHHHGKAGSLSSFIITIIIIIIITQEGEWLAVSQRVDGDVDQE